jgi:hypothetical protein
MERLSHGINTFHPANLYWLALNRSPQRANRSNRISLWDPNPQREPDRAKSVRQ